MDFDLNSLLPVALMLVVGVMALGVGASIIDSMEADAANNTAIDNITDLGGESIDQIGSYLPTIGLVVAAALVITILVVSFKTTGE